MENQFPDDKREERHLYKALELLETEKVEAMLQKNGIHRHTKVIKHDFKMQTTKWWMAAAVLLMATASFFIYVNILQPNPQQLADNSLSTVVDDYNFSYRSSSTDQNLAEFQKAFNNSQWAVAENNLDAALTATAVTDTNALMNIYFYKGVVELKQNNFNDVIINFTPVANFTNGALQKDAVWLRALAHIKNKNFDAAKVDLISTSQFKSWKKAEEAAKILKAIGQNS